MPPQDLIRYTDSSTYSDDLAATHRTWAGSPVLETAGVFVFLTYLSVPALLAVRSGGGATARSTLDGERERLFLQRLLGATDEASWRGGIANRRVRRLVSAVHDRHGRFDGMQGRYLGFMAATIALAPLQVRDAQVPVVPAADRVRYWRYMSHAMSMLGGEVLPEGAARLACVSFLQAHAGPSAQGQRQLGQLVRRHRRYVTLAEPVLFDASRQALRQMAQPVSVD